MHPILFRTLAFLLLGGVAALRAQGLVELHLAVGMARHDRWIDKDVLLAHVFEIELLRIIIVLLQISVLKHFVRH